MGFDKMQRRIIMILLQNHQEIKIKKIKRSRDQEIKRSRDQEIKRSRNQEIKKAIKNK
jgi:hypothetical protein